MNTDQKNNNDTTNKQVLKIVFKDNRFMFGVITEQLSHSFKFKTANKEYLIPHDHVDKIILTERKFGDVPPQNEKRW